MASQEIAHNYVIMMMVLLVKGLLSQPGRKDCHISVVCFPQVVTNNNAETSKWINV